MEQHVTLAEHDALPLLLQHSDLTQDPKAICSMLCVSKSLQTIISQQCLGQMSLQLSSESLDRAQQFAAFLRRWAGLGKTLELEWNRVNMQEAETVLATALQAAREGPAAVPALDAAADFDAICTGPLQIKALKANIAGPWLLSQLPSSTLTCLELGHVSRSAGPGEAAAALARLTGLQSLTVLSASSLLLLPALSSLSALTHACLLLTDLDRNAPQLQLLPPQLHKLELTVSWGVAAAGKGHSSRPPLPLAHLTGLVELRGSGYLALQALDQLPSSLCSLQVPDCPVAQPLTHLVHLTTLNMYNSSAPALQLQKVAAALPHLAEVSLGYFGDEHGCNVDGAAPGWPGLRLVSLDFDGNSGELRLGRPALDALGQLGSSLTQLGLSGGMWVDTTPTGLSQVLLRLTKLHTLRLCHVELQLELMDISQQQQQQQVAPPSHTTSTPPPHPAAAAGGPPAAPAGTANSSSAAAIPPRRSQQIALDPPALVVTTTGLISTHHVLMKVLAGLTSLRSLKLGGLGQWLYDPAHELAPLGAATQLTCLQLMDMGLSDDVVQGLVGGLTQLRELDVSDNVKVGDGALRLICSCLPLLRHLDVSGSRVSEGGVSALKAALPGVDVVCFMSSEEEEWL